MCYLYPMHDQPVADLLMKWYERHRRELPWRETTDPYRIWISEVILQQTRVAQGMDYYLRFTARFPDIHSLAAACEEEVLKLWQGLGYYSRARNLHATARAVVERFGGVFPTAWDDVRSLRGVGDYTAAAICSLAYDAPYAVLDGNVFRVLARLFDVDLPIDTGTGRKAFAELAQSQLDARRAALYNQAIMDFGAMVCTPAQPHCAECPLAERCLALAAGTVARRPVKQGRTKVRERWFNYLHITCGDRTLLTRRGGGDIWQGLYEFPLIETAQATDLTELVRLPQFKRLLGERSDEGCPGSDRAARGDAGGDVGASSTTSWHLLRSVVMPKHQLTHQTIHAVVHRIECTHLPDAASVPTALLGDCAVPRLLERYLTN